MPSKFWSLFSGEKRIESIVQQSPTPLIREFQPPDPFESWLQNRSKSLQYNFDIAKKLIKIYIAVQRILRQITDLLTATVLIYAIGAGITAGAGPTVPSPFFTGHFLPVTIDDSLHFQVEQQPPCGVCVLFPIGVRTLFRVGVDYLLRRLKISPAHYSL